MVKRKIRLPKRVIKQLRDLRDSYPSRRPIPKLVVACLKQTQGVCYLNLTPTPSKDTEKIDLWLDSPFAELEASEIRARITHALIGIESKLLPQQIELNQNSLSKTT